MPFFQILYKSNVVSEKGYYIHKSSNLEYLYLKHIVADLTNQATIKTKNNISKILYHFADKITVDNCINSLPFNSFFNYEYRNNDGKFSVINTSSYISHRMILPKNAFVNLDFFSQYTENDFDITFDNRQLFMASLVVFRGENSYISFYFDSSFQLLTIDSGNNSKYYYIKNQIGQNECKSLINSLSKDMVLFNMLMESFNGNKEVNLILPELITPSAYNFNSYEFNQRLTLASMMTL